MKKNKILAFILAAVAALAMSTAVFAVDPVFVTIDGTPVQYAANDAQPTIYNSRAMVPIRTTAEALGLTVGWDKTTETATFTNADGSRVIRHTMRSNIIYVNGVPSSFDTSSIVVKDRILMPIRMLAEAMGSEVSWDNPSRTVIIMTPKTAVTPKIESAAFVDDEITEGDEATIAVVANSDTKSVRLYYQTGQKDIKEVSEYSDNGDGTRTFRINFTPESDGNVDRVYHVYPGDGNSYSTEYTAVKITVNEDEKKGDNSDDEGLDEYIYKVTLDSTKVEEGDDVKFDIVTTDDVERVRVETNFNSRYTTISDYTETGSKRTFSGKVTAKTTGTCYLYIYVYTNELGKYTDDYRIVSFRGISDEKEDEPDELTIFDIYTAMSATARTEDTSIYVYTTQDVDLVEVFDDEDDRVAYSNYTYDQLSTQNVFKLTWTEKKSGTNRYKVVAYNEDDDETSETIRVTCENSTGTGQPFVLSVEPKKDDIQTGEEATFIVKCNTNTDYIVIKDDAGRTLLNTEGSTVSSGASYKKFSAKVDIASVNCYYTVYAYNDDGDVDEKEFYVYGVDYSDPEIKDIDYDASVEEGDSVSVTVYTTTTVARVWIEDEDDDNVTNKLKNPTKKNTDEYIWEFEFEPDDTGRRVYTIYASDEDEEDYDTTSMRIKVN